MHRFVVYLLILCFSLSGAGVKSRAYSAAQESEKWERYTGKGEEFTVSLPMQPSAATTYRMVRVIEFNNETHYRGNIYAAYSDGVAYLLYSFPRRSEPLTQFIEEFTNRHERIVKFLSERDVTTNGSIGKRYSIKYRDVDGVLDFYVTDKHAYILQAVGADESSQKVSRFLESFALNDRVAQAVEVTPDSKKREAGNSQDAGPVVTSREVTRRPVFVYRPEPQYTEQARREGVSGTITLKAVLSSSGKVTDIEVQKSLPRGLDKKAIEAARRIVFIPAMKDGKFVSQYVRIEYNFNVY
ncbi:MAG TPA: energy transducer TonB [Pyrinomonadaceae bacterium]|nr:energy transducer TonB [Pyrinomonadaceae bacterium]